MDDACILELNGNDYYYPCNYREYLKVIDNQLINIGSSSVTLYHEFPEYGVSSSGYPRIVAPSNTSAYYRGSYNGTISTVRVSSFNFISSHYTFDTYLFIVLIGVMILNLFKR